MPSLVTEGELNVVNTECMTSKLWGQQLSLNHPPKQSFSVRGRETLYVHKEIDISETQVTICLIVFGIVF